MLTCVDLKLAWQKNTARGREVLTTLFNALVLFCSTMRGAVVVALLAESPTVPITRRNIRSIINPLAKAFELL